MSLETWKQTYPVTIEVPVAWGEMDAMGHVNNIIYFRYFESVRIVCFERIGFLDIMRRTGVGPILAEARCRFKIPLQFPDRLLVGTTITDPGEDRFTMLYSVFSEKHQAEAATGDGRIVCFDYQAGKKAPVPEELRPALADLRSFVGA